MMPPESTLSMPVQSLREGRLAAGRLPTSPSGMAWRRASILVTSAVLTLFATYQIWWLLRGGGISVALSKDDKSAIARLASIRMWNRNKPDDDASEELLAGADDRIFRIDRADLRECAELVTDRKELAALRHK